MANWPPVNADKSNEKREKVYLTLVDMFVDVVEPEIIQMVLQNRNWDLDSALEDIMVLSSTSQSEKSITYPAFKSRSNLETRKSLVKGVIEDLKDKHFNGENEKLNHISRSKSAPDNHTFPKPTHPFPLKPIQTHLERDQQKAFKDRQSISKNPQKQLGSKSSYNLFLVPFLDQYNYIKALPVSYDRAVMLIKGNVKLMVILRGPPGSGKSYLAKKLLNDAGIEEQLHKKHIYCTDNYFIRSGVYVFNPDLLSEAHSCNQRNVASAVRDQCSPIIVDNTNMQAWEMRVYADIAVSAGYDLEILEPNNWWAKKEGELAKRNIHGVPKAKIRSMIERYEKNISPQLLMQQFNLHYSLSNVPPQPVPNSKWRDEYGNQKNNRPKRKKDKPGTKNVQSTNSSINMLNTLPMDSNPYSSVNNNSNRESFPSRIDSVTFPSYADCGLVENRNSTSSNTDIKFDFLDSDHVINKSMSSTDIGNTLNVGANFNLNQMSAESRRTGEMLENSIHDQAVSFPDNQVKNSSFDFLAESNKLLAALNNIEITRQKSSLSKSDKVASAELISKSFLTDLSDSVLTTKYNEVIICNDKPQSDVSVQFDYCNDFLKEEESNNESSLVAHDVVESLVDKVINVKGKDSTDAIRTNEVETLWDYVLVDNTNSYVYKRLDVIPLPSIISSKQPLVTNYNNNSIDSEITASLKYEYNGTTTSTGTDHDTKMFSVLEQDDNVSVHDLLTTKISDFDQCTIQNPFLAQSTSSQEEFNQNSDFNTSCRDLGIENQTIINSPPNMHEDINQASNKDSEMRDKDKVNVLELMNDILNSVLPNCENQNDNHLPKSQENNLDANDEFNKWDSSSQLSSNSKEDIQLEMQPKPSRNLTRPKILKNVTPPAAVMQEKWQYDHFTFWETVSNPLDYWGTTDTVVESTAIKEEKSTILPQRHRLGNNNTAHVGTNTNYLDFSLVNHDQPVGVKVLRGRSKTITKDCDFSAKTGVTETLHLDKGTMTVCSNENQSVNLDRNQISNLFPDIPEKYILDVIEKCQGDIDWAVDLLLDSEHSIYALENNEYTNRDKCSNEIAEDLHTIVASKHDKIGPKREAKTNTTNTQELIELKRKLENSVIFGKDHYSDKVLKVLKKKHPDYLLLVENNSVTAEKITKTNVEASDNEDEHGRNSEDEVEDINVDGNIDESSSNSVSEAEKEDDTLDIIINNDLIVQLQQTFGHSNLPTSMMNVSPVVKLPVSLARQMYGYIMDSMQTELETQQNAIENMIAQDEEIAKLLQDQVKPQLQEIMDMELALAVHKADQEEWKANSKNTVAATLSKNILLEKFPNVDSKMLMEVLHAHNYSLHDTIASLSLALDVDHCNYPTLQNPLQYKERPVPGSGLVEEASCCSVDPLEEAQSHRDEASSYYSLRMDCLNKAQEAFRSGNKPVASYYSRLAQLHKDKMTVCNSRAAACLLSAHKCGTNTLDLHFLHVMEAEIVLDMFIDEVVTKVNEKKKKHQIVYLITGRGLRSVGGVSRIKPMVQRKLQGRGVLYNEVNPGMLSALVRSTVPLSCTS